MQLEFRLVPVAAGTPASDITVNIDQFIVGGWAGRNREAIEHHIEELAELGVPRPSAIPLYYRIASDQLTQADTIQVVGDQTSGETEVLLFNHQGEHCISLVSDHTDRALEAHSVALSKQICAKPVGRTAWRLADVADHWDSLVLKAWIEEDGREVRYQDDSVSALRHPEALMRGHFDAERIPADAAMSCGTVGAIGGIRPSTHFIMVLSDPVLKRELRHEYHVQVLPEIA
ncbi:MAG: DUF2848 domain-containing protein [Castellaniella sp.]